MGYDYHWNGSQPGPVAPITWIREVLTYARTQISPQKVLLGIPVAGYDWVDGRGEEVTWQQCFDRSKAFKATVHYNGEHEAPWFRYTDAQGREHEVWFENADSTKAKLDAVRASGIRGVYLWMYGGADGRTWDQLRHFPPTNRHTAHRHGHGTVLKQNPATATGPQQILVWVADPVAPHKRIRRYELIDLVPRTASSRSPAADASSHTRPNR